MVNKLFHASPVPGIQELEPRIEATPSVENKQSPARVYASDNAAYSAGHGFSWSTAEGIDLGFISDENGNEFV